MSNTRIKELEQQSYITVKDENSFDCLVFSKQKFAELIVKECAEIASCNGHVSGFALGDLIKEHLGVEE